MLNGKTALLVCGFLSFFGPIAWAQGDTGGNGSTRTEAGEEISAHSYGDDVGYDRFRDTVEDGEADVWARVARCLRTDTRAFPECDFANVDL